MKMKFALLVSLFFTSAVFAQTDKKPSSIGFSFGFSDFQAPYSIKNGSVGKTKFGGTSDKSTAFVVQYWQGLTSNINISVGYSGAFLTNLSPDFPDRTADYFQSLEAAFHVMMLHDKAFVNPFLTAGLGAYGYKNNFGAQAPLGVGLQINPFNSYANILAQADYKLKLNNDYTNHIFYSIGVLVPLQEPKAKILPPPPPPPPPADTDKDGIIDSLDKCPTVAGTAKYNGCPVPDSDGDGINDEEDKCPTVAGTAKYGGCPVPDSDNDGINDENDKCPNQAGFARYGGCPIPDTDGDGVNDEEDRCPTIAGPATNKGCPILEQYNFNAKNVQFATGNAILTKGAVAELDKLVTILNEHTELKISIDGYTDNTGSAKTNEALSQKRADAVKTYLVKKGIDGSRLTAIGHGPDNPIADNKTAAGRAQNRRVEFSTAE